MKPLFDGPDWTIDLIDKTWRVIDKIGKDVFNLDYYDAQIELITSEQMLECYSSVAMPIMYSHWSFGKSFIRDEQMYKKGQQGLAYEVVINTDPCIAYLVENNSMTMQTLVMAHALCGHGSFFKNNYLFCNWTNAKSILDYLKFAKNYIKRCEEKYGVEEVESVLDACHSIQHNSIDKYKKPQALDKEAQRQREEEWIKYAEQTFSDLWRTARPATNLKKRTVTREENLLKFIEKNAPNLPTWKREVCRIVRKLAQYFYPQMQTQLMNEGWATFTHYNIMTEMHQQGYLTDGSYLEFLHSHSSVIAQPNWTRRWYRGINVYALGFAMMQDIRRICENPTEEDRRYFPDICGTDWKETLQYVMRNYRDESFVLQFLSPKVIRDFKLFVLAFNEKQPFLTVNATHGDEDVYEVRRVLAQHYDINRRIPKIEVVEVYEEDRALQLEYTSELDSKLEFKSTKKVIAQIEKLWGFPVYIEYKTADGEEVPAV